MPTAKKLPKYPKIRRPVIATSKSLRERRSQTKKLMQMIYIRKLQKNNVTLAKALNKQKMETQKLTHENITLTGQVNDLLRVNRHISTFNNILQDSKESLKLIVKLSEFMTNTITSCNSVMQSEVPTSYVRPQGAAPEEREGIRRIVGTSPNKSPARGVVQPMVSGHAIAQPAIALSRLRIAVSPNVSVIEEGDESNTSTPGSTVTRRMPPSRPTRPVDRAREPILPQRIRISPPRRDTRRSDEMAERRLSIRRSSRYHRRKSRSTGRRSDQMEPTPPRSSIGDINVRSPRVSLQDVSRLMQNSQSINVRTLMDTSADPEVSAVADALATSGTFESGEASDGPTPTASPTCGFGGSRLGRKRRKEEKPREEGGKENRSPTEPSRNSSSYDHDPLEGTSQDYNQTSEDLFGQSANDTVRENNETLKDFNEPNPSTSQLLYGSFRASEGRPSVAHRVSLPIHNNYDDDDDEDDEDDDRCGVINVRPRAKPVQQNGEEPTTDTALFRRNVCTSRGYTEEFDLDEFTMMARPAPKPQLWTMDDLELPEIPPATLETPLVARAEVIPEPETTNTISIVNGVHQQIVQQMPYDFNVTLNTNVTMPIETAGRDSEDDTTIVALSSRKRVPAKPIVESSSESDSSSPPQKKKASRGRAKTVKRRDPSSAKVVLEKLKEPNRRSTSPDPRSSAQSVDSQRISTCSMASHNSDSESSTASVGSRQESGRPRRQKAPVNLREPSLTKKLRRQ